LDSAQGGAIIWAQVAPFRAPPLALFSTPAAMLRPLLCDGAEDTVVANVKSVVMAGAAMDEAVFAMDVSVKSPPNKVVVHPMEMVMCMDESRGRLLVKSIKHPLKGELWHTEAISRNPVTDKVGGIVPPSRAWNWWGVTTYLLTGAVVGGVIVHLGYRRRRRYFEA
jgi:hypothetical protein